MQPDQEKANYSFSTYRSSTCKSEKRIGNSNICMDDFSVTRCFVVDDVGRDARFVAQLVRSGCEIHSFYNMSKKILLLNPRTEVINHLKLESLDGILILTGRRSVILKVALAAADTQGIERFFDELISLVTLWRGFSARQVLVAMKTTDSMSLNENCSAQDSTSQIFKRLRALEFEILRYSRLNSGTVNEWKCTSACPCYEISAVSNLKSRSISSVSDLTDDDFKPKSLLGPALTNR